MSNTPDFGQSLGRTSLTFRILILAATVAVFALVTVGVVVRVTESGLGCPDWPLCHGKLIPPFEYHTILEYSHRLVASLVGFLVVLSASVGWLRYRNYGLITRPLFIAVILVGVAALLGREAVLTELSPNIVTLHFAIAEIIFALLIVSAVSAWFGNSTSAKIRSTQAGKNLLQWAQISALAVYIILLSGSYVVGQGATAVCPSWPHCGGVSGGFLPRTGLEWVHMSHRFLSAAGTLIVAWLTIRIWAIPQFAGTLARTGRLIFLIVILQILAGAANPWFDFPIVARVVHLSLATALWGILVLLVTLLWVNKSKYDKSSIVV